MGRGSRGSQLSDSTRHVSPESRPRKCCCFTLSSSNDSTKSHNLSGKGAGLGPHSLNKRPDKQETFDLDDEETDSERGGAVLDLTGGGGGQQANKQNRNKVFTFFKTCRYRTVYFISR